MELIGVGAEGRTRQKKLKQQLGQPEILTIIGRPHSRALLSTAMICSDSHRRSGISPLLSPWTG